MKIFGLELDPGQIDAIADHGEREFPSEACGVVLGAARGSALVRVVPLSNVQDRYHQKDPARFPRTGRDAFRIDELERMRVLEAAESEGLVERVLYHSHPNAGAYFSPEDRAMAVIDGMELMPGVVNLVVSIRDGRRHDMAAFRFDAQAQRFEEVRIPLSAREGFPDLESRVMEGSESARPIVPVGRGLISRRVTETEAETLRAMTGGRKVILNDSQLRDVIRLGRGYLSPLSGFMRAAEVASVEAHGRLLSGTPWRLPVLLSLRGSVSSWEPGAVVELEHPAGRPIAALGILEAEAQPADRVTVAGPVFVYPETADRDGPDAADQRAEILRRAMTRVLAIPATVPSATIAEAKLTEFDGFLSSGPLVGALAPKRMPFPMTGRDAWCDSAMAQNLGATHIWLEDAGIASTVRETLAVVPWSPSHRS